MEAWVLALIFRWNYRRPIWGIQLTGVGDGRLQLAVAWLSQLVGLFPGAGFLVTLGRGRWM